jgi:predicted aldo/keto reductase-like oxidoreductase
MEKIRLGRTGLYVSRSGFGALPIQRIDKDEARLILRKAFSNGINFFDTARGYTDSEEKIGYSLADVREEVIIATKTPAHDRKTLFENLETSLSKMKTDYIDIYQLHNPSSLPDPDDPESLYGGLLEAKKKGMIRFIGITNHRLDIAINAVRSGHYDTIQFPLSSLSSDEDLKLVEISKDHDVGVIAMKALSGGLITNASIPFAFLRRYDNLVPIWGIQRESELDEFIALEKNPPEMNEEMLRLIEKDRAELTGAFCRGCGYCMPCPAGIPINLACRMSHLLARSPYARFLEDDWREKMELINKCTGCGQCKKRCPYELDIPNVLKAQLVEYHEFYKLHKA